jgi:hypothetical protein
MCTTDTNSVTYTVDGIDMFGVITPCDQGHARHVFAAVAPDVFTGAMFCPSGEFVYLPTSRLAVDLELHGLRRRRSWRLMSGAELEVVCSGSRFMGMIRRRPV